MGATAGRFARGDTVCLIGDSITHAGSYHGNVLLFYATRFPQDRFELHNCGLSGDSAQGALRRFDHDIAVHRPTVAAIMLGMNDVGREWYGRDRTGPEDQERRRLALEAHVRDMDDLAGRLAALGSRIIAITPSIYDQTGSQATPNLYGVNDALGRCGDHARALAVRTRGGVVDFHGPMTRINAERQARDPDFTVVGGDRVHPGEPGHLVMSYLFLAAQGMTPLVSGIAIDAARGTAIGEGCAVTGLTTDATSVSFTCLARSLPFPIHAEASPGLELVPFIDDLDREMLCVTGLAPGRYALAIDGELVHEASAAELAQGLNLATNPRTPQYRQALEAKAHKDRRQALVALTRTVEAIWHFTLGRIDGLQRDDLASCLRIMTGRLEEAKAAGNGFAEWEIGTYLEHRPRLAEIRQEICSVTDGMWQACIPRPHRYTISRLG